MDVEQVLLREGCAVAGLAGSVALALKEIAQAGIDATLLDINLGREKVFPVADKLAAAGIPVVLVTGQSHEMLPEAHRKQQIVSKPYGRGELIKALLRALAG